jgi:hypothetical protein
MFWCKENLRICYLSGFYKQGLFITLSSKHSIVPGTKWLCSVIKGAQLFKVTKNNPFDIVTMDVDGVSAAGVPSMELMGLPV